MKPIIGIISRNKEIDGNKNSTLQFHYVNAIYKAGGLPIIIPVILDDELILDYLNQMDGLLIPGGIDVNPKWYHEDILPECGTIDDELDLFEFKVIGKASELQLPILAICRGHQVVNVAYKGSLYQDLSYYEPIGKLEIHEQNKLNMPKHEPIHQVKVIQDSILYEIVGSMVHTNSFHHQIVNDLGENLKVVGMSCDGVIEAFEGTTDHFVMGIQWHPEKMVNDDKEQLKIFIRFIEECRSKSERSKNS